MAILSPWLEVAAPLVELIAHLTDIATGVKDLRSLKPLIRPDQLVILRMHMAELAEVTRELAHETHTGELSPRYPQLRERWLRVFAPLHTVLHAVDPTALATVGIYSPRLSMLLETTLRVTERTLNEALKAEREEISYDTDSHLCTLCLQL